MSMVVEPLISGLVENLVSIATSFIGSKLQIGENSQVQAQVEDWKIILEDISGFLIDAEVKKENPAVKRWLDDLEELIFNAEDLIEHFNYEVLRRQLEHPAPEPSCSSSYLGNWKRRRTEESWENSDLPGKLKNITGKFQRLKDRKNDLNLFILSLPSSTRLQPSRFTRDPSGPLPTEPVIFGRENDKRKIIQILKEGQTKLGVLPIVGMGGLGKTTLARYVFNDEEIKSHFDVRVWVCVSVDYDTKRITKDILDGVSQNDDVSDVKDKALGWIQAKLGEKLRNKKFLLVLDDTWNENYKDWTTLTSPLNEGLSGSKIIVTTRDQNVADKVKTVPCIIPNLLSEHDCWSLFCTHANLNPNGTSFFEIVGKEIAKKCSGLPLAAMTVGGMLRDKVKVEEWEDIQNSRSWTSEDVMPILKMSYNDLTPQLKRCFAFFSLYPGDYDFEEEEIVLLWIGAGLILSLNGAKSKKEVAHDCFRKLLSRSLFSLKPFKWADEKLYTMHGLVRELARQVSSRKLYLANDDTELVKSSRHLSFGGSTFQTVFERIIEGGKVTGLPLRTALILNRSFSLLDLPKQMDEMFLRLQNIRALYFQGFCGSKLPESFGQMKLLRYLNLCGSDEIEMLPISITSLYNLEILILRSCSSLQQLPEHIERLIHLWYLDITDCDSLKELPERIKELKWLEKLSHFTVNEKLPMGSLGNLKLLRGRLEICGLEKVASPEDAGIARLSEKRLDELVLSWNGSWNDDWRKKETESKILEQLRPHENLKLLRIVNYGGQMFPCWLNSSFRCLTVLEIEDCGNCNESVTSIDLVLLKKLTIVKCGKMEVHLAKMPNLKTLRLCICNYVGCTDTFSTAELDILDIHKCTISELFKEKVRLGFPNAKILLVNSLFPYGSGNRCWHLPSFKMIADTYDEEVKVEELYVHTETIEHLPLWVCKAKSLKRITVEKCQYLTDLLPYGYIPPSLTEIVVYDCPKLNSILRQDPLSEHCYGSLTPHNLVSLTSISIQKCAKMEVHLTRMPNLKTLRVRYCSYVGCTDTFSTATLESLKIEGCRMSELFKEKVRLGLPNARSLFIKKYMGGFMDVFCDICWSIEDLSMIADNYDEEIKVEKLYVNIEMIERLPQWVSKAKSLKVICVTDCPCLREFLPSKDLPPSVTEIIIKNCPNMEVHLTRMPNLKTLHLENSSYVRCTDSFTTTALDHLTIKKCRMSELFKKKVRLGCLSARYLDIATNTLCSISEIIADNYDEEIKVQQLRVSSDSSIQHLQQWVCKAKFLLMIEVKECLSLKKLFSYRDIPPSLSSIRIENCPQLTSILSQDSLPEKVKSLNQIYIRHCPSLKALLPAEFTTVDDCILLESFHGEGLPSHCIRSLTINNCPLLTQKLRDRDAKLCSKIFPKAYITVDGNRFDLT